jgi:chloramphenicol 3-O phosphotransferase
MTTGRVILLNGTSSSGKTALAKALQRKLAEPYMHVSIDGFFHLYPKRLLHPRNREEAQVVAGLLPAVASGMHGSVAALASAGNNVIVDHVLQEQGWLRECVERWSGLEVLFVGVMCPLEVLEKREKKRRDRSSGTARYQFERVHGHGVYDIDVDTSVLSPNECAVQIAKFLKERPHSSAFQNLAVEFAAEDRRRSSL